MNILWAIRLFFFLPFVILFVVDRAIRGLIGKRHIESLKRAPSLPIPGESDPRKRRRKLRIAFFHPYCNACGGGEKVLWCMVNSILSDNDISKGSEITILHGEKETPENMLKKAEARFNIPLVRHASEINFVYVEGRHWLEPKRALTMALQALGSVYYALRCIFAFQADVFIDSTGFAFAFWPVRRYLPYCRIGAYVHYPFISSDMLADVANKRKRFNNTGRIADSSLLSAGKVYYYKLVAKLYKAMGKRCDFVLTNSTWTNNHMTELWGAERNNLRCLFPPCNVKHLVSYPVPRQASGSGSGGEKEIWLMSFAQFRPEKEHIKQIRIFEKVLAQEKASSVKFRIVGSCRDDSDERLLNTLREDVQKRGLQDRIQFVKNPPFSELLGLFKSSHIGVHTMEAEHFGIAVVEMMAAGLLVVAHNSAGPKFDIIKNGEECGFLCETEDDYVQGVLKAIQIIKNQPEQYKKITFSARERAAQFSDEEFMRQCSDLLKEWLTGGRNIEQQKSDVQKKDD